MIKKNLFLLLAALLPAQLLLAQNVSVNPLTGAANVVVPVANYQRGSIKFPINLIYIGAGVKSTDVEGTAGMNWNLQCSSYAVSRQVRGLPDDCQKDIANNTRTGWMYAGNASAINTFTIHNNGTPNCSNETIDITAITATFPYTVDIEPDLFYVNAPGLSCQLVYDQSSGKFKPVEYQDLQISDSTATDGEIVAFTIVNDAGTKYIFNKPENAYMRDSSSTAPLFFGNAYNQYRHGILYTDRWCLTSIADINENGIQINYTSGAARGSQDSVKLYIGGSSTASLQYITYGSVTPQQISTIVIGSEEDGNLSNETLTFHWTTPVLEGSGQSVIDSISGRGRTYSFNYHNVKYSKTGSSATYYREFLSSFSENSCGSPIFYGFSYAGVTQAGAEYDTTLPDTTSTQNDYWGYYSTKATTGNLLPALFASPSGSYPPYLIKASSTNSSYSYTLSGANRMVDTSAVYTGSLIKVTNVMGGSTAITYESNDYNDPSAGANVQGGGVRVKQLTDYDGISSAHTIVRTYSYVRPGGSTSSGKPITMPQYAITIPYTGSATGSTMWTDATAVSPYDLSTEDHTIIYEYEKESQSGIGSKLTQFYVPATAWDAHASPDCNGCTTEWRPTVDLAARSSCSTYKVLLSGPASYPFIPNPNYDFERGLPRKITTYNNSGLTASVESFGYSRTASPSVICGFKWEDSYTGSLYYRGYNRDTIYYNTRELLTNDTTIVYDATNYSQANQTSVAYTYGSTYHKLATKQTVNSDGSNLTDYFWYVKDYTTGTDTSGYVTALYHLQQLNVNAPVETYTKVQNSLGTFYTQAHLTLFRPFTPVSATIYRPFRQLSMVQPDGITTFTQFEPSGNTIVYDSHYFTTADYMDYDYAGVLLSSDNGNKREGSRLFDHETDKPVAVFTNARVGEVWFEDFDSDYYIGGRETLTGVTDTTDRNGKNAAYLATTGNITFTITKNPNAVKYIFSAWLRSSSATGFITVKLSDGTNILTRSITPGVTTGWQYFELPKFSVTTLGSSITVTLTTTAAMSLDDILLYPENTEATTYAFDDVQFYKICQTNTNGVSAYFKNDAWGRVIYAYDQDHNILNKNVYVPQADAANFNTSNLSITVTNTGTLTTNTMVNLLAQLPPVCEISSNTYTWRFGDGSAPVQTSGTSAPAHQYKIPGTYIDTLVLNSNIFGQLTVTHSVTFVAGPNTNLAYTNNTPAHLNTLAFYNGATLVASFTEAQLQAGTAQVVKGSYTMKITMATGASGYTSIKASGDGTSGACVEYSSTNTYSVTINISSTNNLLINVSTTDLCGT